MYGPAFLSRDFSNQLIPLIEEAYHQPGTEQWYWEQVVVDHIKELDFSMNCQPTDQVYEFENLEELRLFDPKYQNHSDNAAMQLVAHVFNVKEEAIHNIRCLKSGMTNQSFLFELDGKHYICRIPGPGTEFLINRKEEEAVYKAVTPLGITEHILYFDGKTGYKIAQYYEGARNADAKNPQEMAACMEMLRKLHHSGVTVPHTFRIRERIDFYERICRGHEEMLFEDYPAVRARMNELMDGIKEAAETYLIYDKSTYSSFQVPAIRQAAREADRIILTGVVSECCVLSTFLEGIDLGCKPIWLTDATSGLNPILEAETLHILQHKAIKS